MCVGFSALSIFWGALAGTFLSLAILSGVKYREIRGLGGTFVIYKSEAGEGVGIGLKKEEMLKQGEKVHHFVDVGAYFKFSAVINTAGFSLTFVGAILTALIL